MTNTHRAAALLVPEGQPLKPGCLYLHLYHGRRDPDESMETWGFSGPTFGPLYRVRLTYFGPLHFSYEEGAVEFWLEQHEDMIV